MLFGSGLVLLVVAFRGAGLFRVLTVVDVTFGCATLDAAVLLGVLTLSLVTEGLSPVEGRRVPSTSERFAALPLSTGRLSEVEGRHGVATAACFCARSLVTGRLSAVEGRPGVETSAGFLAVALVMGCFSPIEVTRPAAEEGLLTPVTPSASFSVILRVRGAPAIFCDATLELRTLFVLVFWFVIMLGFTEPGVLVTDVRSRGLPATVLTDFGIIMEAYLSLGSFSVFLLGALAFS